MSNERKTLFGIDLGTTNSAISVLTSLEGTSKILRLSNGKTTLPSCVMWTKKDGFTVGDEAYNLRWKNNVVYSIKRHMGTEHLTTLTDDEGNSITLTPEEVSAEILKALARDAESLGYGKVSDVTITVPAYFDNNQRAATVRAGELAGFNVRALNIINEPTAASLSYGLDKSVTTGNVMVYDLGGGTFDATLLKIEKIGAKKKIGKIKLGSTTEESSVINVLSNGGNNKLGGDDIDDIVLKKACRALDDLMAQDGHTTNFLFELPKEAREKLKADIERIKKTPGLHSLTATVDTTLTTGLAVNKTIPITMKMLEEATHEIFDKTMLAVNQCIETSSEKNFGKIVLVGGSTKSEKIQELLHLTFPDKIIYSELNPDESVAIGAAIMTGIKSGSKGIKLFDVIPLPIGIKSAVKRDDGNIMDDRFVKLINKDTPIPASSKHYFTNSMDDGSEISLDLYQGTKSIATMNTYIGTLTIDSVPAKPVGEVKIEINTLVDINGILSLKVSIDGVEHKAKFSSVFNSQEAINDLPDVPEMDYSELDTLTVGNISTTNKSDKDKITTKPMFETLTMSDNPKVKKWTSNIYRWKLSEETKQDALKMLKGYDSGTVSEEEIVGYMKLIKKEVQQ